jgi:hypothetical protein
MSNTFQFRSGMLAALVGRAPANQAKSGPPGLKWPAINLLAELFGLTNGKSLRRGNVVASKRIKTEIWAN